MVRTRRNGEKGYCEEEVRDELLQCSDVWGVADKSTLKRCNKHLQCQASERRYKKELEGAQ